MPVISFEKLRAESKEKRGFQDPKVYSQMNFLDARFREAVQQLQQNPETQALGEELSQWIDAFDYARNPMINQDDQVGLDMVRTNLEKLGGFRDFLHHTDENGITNFEKIYAQVGLEFPRDKETFISDLATMSNVGELGLEVGRLQHIYDCRTKGREICSRVRENPDYARLAELMTDQEQLSEVDRIYDQLEEDKEKYTLENQMLIQQVQTAITGLKEAFSDFRHTRQKTDTAKRDFLLKNTEKLTTLSEQIASLNKSTGLNISFLNGEPAKGKETLQDLFDADDAAELLKIGEEANSTDFVLSKGATYEQAAAHLAQLIDNDDDNNKDFKTFTEIGSKLNARANPQLKHTNKEDQPLYILATNYNLLKKALKNLADKPTAENLQAAGKKLEEFTSFSNSFAASFPEFAQDYKNIVGPFNEQMKNNCFSYAEIHFPNLKPVTLENEPGHKHGQADAEIRINIGNQDNDERHENDILEPGPEENLIQANEAENQDHHPEVQTADMSDVDNYYYRYARRFEDLDPEKRLSYLARTIAACIMREQLRSGTIRHFNRKDADRNAAELMKKPAIRQIAKDQNQFNGIMFRSKWEAAEEGGKLINPFSGEKERQRQALSNLKELLYHMDAPAGRSTKWKNLVNSLKAIDLNNEATYTQQLQNIYNKNEIYMKGKKSVRYHEDGQHRFDQSLDVLSELSTVSGAAKNASQLLLDRTNEVRRGHNPEHVDLRFEDYGLQNAVNHENPVTHAAVRQPAAVEVQNGHEAVHP